MRHLQERRRRAAIRRRNALAVAAIASAVIGAIVGSGAGGGDSPGASEPIQLSRGGLGPPPDTGDLGPYKKPVPMLMYHVVADPPASAHLPELYVDPHTFNEQMEALSKRGYSGVSLNQVYDAWFKDGELPAKPVIVSFDDGYRGQYLYARPELRRLGWPGVLNLLVRTYTEPDGELTAQMVKRMINNGWELDSHTIDHLDVTKLSPGNLRLEIGHSRTILQHRFHQPVNFFCYPAGRFDARAVRAVQRAGYLGATTTQEGLAAKDAMYKLKRIRVDGSDGVAGLEQKLSAAGA